MYDNFHKDTTLRYTCNPCRKPHFDFSDSYLNSTTSTETAFVNDQLNDSTNSDNINPYMNLRDLRIKHIKNFIFGHLNINSIRYKFDSLSEIFDKNYMDFLMIGETKLDSSFQSALFQPEGYKLYRKDKTQFSGGLMVFVRSDLPSRQLVDLETKSDISNIIQTVIIDVRINNVSWLFICCYRPPSGNVKIATSELSKTIDKCLIKSDNIIIVGDLNCNMLDPENDLVSLNETFDLTNMVKQPTCFKSVDGTIIDVSLTNRPKYMVKTQVIDIGLSDFHHLVVTVKKGFIPNQN